MCVDVDMNERRDSIRSNKIFRVRITSEELGDQWYVARNISESGMFVQMADPLPLRARVIVRFQRADEDAAICAMAKIQNHYYFQYNQEGEMRGLSGVGIRFLRFVPEAGDRVPDDQLH